MGLLEGFFGQRLFVRIHRDWLEVRDATSGRRIKEPPLVALTEQPKRTVAAFGAEAARLRGRPGIRVVNPFDHPRTPLADFEVAELLVRHLVRNLGGGAWFRPSPPVVIGLAEKPEGGLTQIEARALHELAIGGARASRVFVWDGPDLSDEQVRKLQFPTTGEVLPQ